MSPKDPEAWAHPQAKKLYEKLRDAHVKWLKAHPDQESRSTDAEFAELKRKRDASIRATIEKMAAELGWEPSQMRTHVSCGGECYCACPDGPCQHEWTGWVEFDNGGSRTCGRCGMTAMSHDMRCGP